MQQSDCSQLVIPQWRHLASIFLFAYNFLKNCPISTIFGNQKITVFTPLQHIQKYGR